VLNGEQGLQGRCLSSAHRGGRARTAGRSVQTWAGGLSRAGDLWKGDSPWPGPRAGIHISQPGPLRVGHGGPSEDGSGTRSSRRSASAGEARVSRAVATLAGVAGRSGRPPAGRRFWTGLETVERGVSPIDFPIEFPMAADPCLWAAGRAIYR